jgi:glycosyltransferase involved in cell wall biosynthesis
MNILWFTNTSSLACKIVGKSNYFGGWIESLQQLISEREDINLAIAFYSGDFNESKVLYERVVYYPIEIKKFSIAERYFNFENESKLLNKIIKIVDDFQPDVIHIFGTESVFAGIASQIKVPILVHLQGLSWPILNNWLPSGIEMNQVLFNSSFIKLLRGSGVFRSYYRLKRQAFREIKNIKLNTLYTGRTDWDKSYIRLLNPNAQYYHVDEILREPFYHYTWAPSYCDKVKLLSTIGPNIFKGLDIVLKTAYELKKNSNIAYEWNLVGIQENDELVKIFERIFKLKFCSLNVNFLGLKNPYEIIELMKTSSLFIHPSHVDNSPNSICEAMLVGMPVIAANVGGINSLINDGENGFLYTDYDVPELFSLICEVGNLSQNLKILIKNAKQTALKRHDKAEIVSSTIRLYSKLAKKVV